MSTTALAEPDAPNATWAAEYVRTAWPYAACLLAGLLAWPAGWAGRSARWHLPLNTHAGAHLLLGALACGIVVALIVREPWLRVGVAAGVAALSWALTGPPAPTADGRLLPAALLGSGLVLGLAVGGRVESGIHGVSTALAVLAGVSPSSWPHAPVLAVAMALPFWLATRDRVAPTLWAVARTLLVFVVARVLAASFTKGWAAGTGAGSTPGREMTRRVGAATWDTLRLGGLDLGRAALTTHTSWVWGGAVLALWIVAARFTTRALRR